MFGLVSKKKYDLLLKQVFLLREISDISAQSLKKFNTLTENATKNQEHFYSIGDDIYAFCVHKITKESALFFTAKITDSDRMTLGTPICRMSVEFSLEKMSIHLLNIDTFGEERVGHASRMLAYVTRLAERADFKTIYGSIWSGSPSGIPVLKNFYEKNGFEVQGTGDSLRFVKRI